LKIQKGGKQNLRRTDNTMATSTKGQTTIYKTYI